MRNLTILILLSLCVLEAQTWQHFTTENSPLPDNKINSITFGTDGTVWVATPSGLAAYKNGNWKTFNSNDGLSSNLINTLLLISNGDNDLWLGTDNGTTNFLVNEDNIASELSLLNRDNTALLSNNILSMGIDYNSAIWLGTDNGITVIQESDVFNITAGGDEAGYGIKNGLITDIKFGKDSMIYAATNGGGVGRFYYDEVDGLTSASRVDSDWSQLRSDSVFTVCIVNDTIRWYGTNWGIFMHYGKEKNGNELIESSARDNPWGYMNTSNCAIIDNYVRSLSQDKLGNVWAGTKGGISVYTDTTWSSFTEADGLVSNNVFTIAADEDNNIWIGTDAGISKLSGLFSDIEDPEELNKNYELSITAYPNPFNPSTKISYSLSTGDNVKLNIYNITGQLIATINNNYKPAGKYEITWNGRNNNGVSMSSGIYFATIETSSSVKSQKIVLLR